METFLTISLLLIPIGLITLRQQHEEIKTTTMVERVQRAGYECETYDTFTDDGYGLRLFRLRNSTSFNVPEPTTPPRPVVFLMHGIASSSESWVLESLSNPLAYELLKQGFDVWLGNNRGSTYGKSHRNLSASQSQFWRFSFHEIGTIDLPHMVDFILGKTQQSSLHYVGYSQGTTVAFVLLSMRPEYNGKFKTLSMLAPVAYLNHCRSILRHLAGFLGIYTPVHSWLGDRALWPPWFLRRLLGLEACGRAGTNPKLCTFLMFKLFGGYSAYLEETLLPEIFQSHPATLSMHQLLHFMQLTYSQKFRQYDFGPDGNLQRYNQSTPPEYNLSNIRPTLPLHLFYSDYDEIVSKTDVEMLAEKLGNHSVSHFIDLPYFAHIDFVWGSNIEDVINRPIVEIMNNAEKLLQTNPRSQRDLESG
ncbi:lipase 3 [Stomoxys calcitrans]|uniref:lipase 3 n=1 Tax=Stomoxys calcitrans TaxID=35570 RepID=UPI0027E338B4|nr:lipase 3 [Stomoxys calcitrans]